MSGTLQNSQPRTSAPRRTVTWSTDLVAMGAAVVCVLVMWLCLSVWGGVDLAVSQNGQVREIGGVAVVLSAAVAGLLGVGTLRLLERSTRHALRIWTVLAIAVTLISALGPLAATSAAATGVLLAMHAIVAVVLIVSMHRIRRW